MRCTSEACIYHNSENYTCLADNGVVLDEHGICHLKLLLGEYEMTIFKKIYKRIETKEIETK